MAGDDTRISLVRSGGLAGLRLCASVRVGDLPAEAAVTVRSVLEGVDLAAVEAAAGAPTGADRFQYDLQVEAEGRTESVSLAESQVPPELRPLLGVLVPLAQPC